MESATLTLRPRADATSASLVTGSDGCVICTSTASCPKCPSGQECNLRARTCSSCPEYVCVPSGDSSSSGTPIGGIVGGVLGGVAVISIVLGLYYFLVYRKKKALTNDIDLDHESYFGSSTHAGFEDDAGSGEKAERPRAVRSQSTQSLSKQAQISSYDSFMRPPGYHKRGNRRSQIGAGASAGAGVAQNGGGANPAAAGPASSSVYSNGNNRRYSMETTASTTNASNILPIAYIPGVTIRATRNNTGSIYSAEDSVFSDFTGIDNASIVQQQGTGPPLRSTMTAIKAQPRLVNVGKIDEDEEEDEEDEEVSQAHDTSTMSAWNHSSSTWNHSDSFVKSEARVEEQSVDESNAFADSDSDVDSDIGEIHRATSTRRERDLRTAEPDEPHDNESDGSFTLDIGR